MQTSETLSLPPGVTPMTPDQAKLQRRMVLILSVLPFAGFGFAIFTLWGSGLSSLDAGIALGLYVFTGLGVTIGYHRLFTHQSFQANRPLKIALAIGGSMAIQGSLIDWVATHRRHHAFSDRDGDPHSPHLDEGEGIQGVARGLWHAHMGWLKSPETTHAERWAPDLLKDKDLVAITKWSGGLVALSLTLPPIIGLLATRSWEGAVTAFLWGSLARLFFLHHVTWSINSICHFYGKRPFQTPDFSTNNWVLAILSFGESWHNNHHAFPTSAVHGIGRGQFDISGGLIRLFEKLRWATNVRIVTPKQLIGKTISNFKVRASVLDPGPSSATAGSAEQSR